MEQDFVQIETDIFSSLTLNNSSACFLSVMSQKNPLNANDGAISILNWNLNHLSPSMFAHHEFRILRVSNGLPDAKKTESSFRYFSAKSFEKKS